MINRIMSKPTAFFPGRFQPFHTGHMLVVEGMTKVCGKIIIGIGSSEESGTEENPFSAQERKEMIQRALQAKNLIPVFDINFVDLPDKATDEEWADHVMEIVGDVDKVWTGQDDIKACFEGKLEIQNIAHVPGIDSEEIRKMIASGDKVWKEKVPSEVASAIAELKR